MNRREALTSLLAVAGTGAAVEEVKAEPKPLLFVLHVPDSVDDRHYALIRRHWEEVVWGESVEKAPPLFILPPDIELETVLDPRNRE